MQMKYNRALGCTKISFEHGRPVEIAPKPVAQLPAAVLGELALADYNPFTQAAHKFHGVHANFVDVLKAVFQ